jgi:NUDIX domain
MAAARREAMEETGCVVRVHEFLGVISYLTSTGPKIAHFWQMRATGSTVRTPTVDIKAVEWLPLSRGTPCIERNGRIVRHVSVTAHPYCHTSSFRSHFDVTILVAIIALLAIELLHLAISLPREITDPDAVAGDKPKPVK